MPAATRKLLVKNPMGPRAGEEQEEKKLRQPLGGYGPLHPGRLVAAVNTFYRRDRDLKLVLSKLSACSFCTLLALITLKYLGFSAFQ